MSPQTDAERALAELLVESLKLEGVDPAGIDPERGVPDRFYVKPLPLPGAQKVRRTENLEKRQIFL